MLCPITKTLSVTHFLSPPSMLLEPIKTLKIWHVSAFDGTTNHLVLTSMCSNQPVEYLTKFNFASWCIMKLRENFPMTKTMHFLPTLLIDL